VRRMLVAEQWDQFARIVLPPNCDLTQKTEMRRAFYAGAQGVLHAAMQAISHKDEPTSEDLGVMVGIGQELKDFVELVRAGRA
jgi:hypothetical protein